MPDIVKAGLGPDELPQSVQLGETGVVTTDLGRIVPLPRGAWDPEYTYDFLDMVRYNGTRYIARRAGLKGVTPVDGEDWMRLSDTDGKLGLLWLYRAGPIGPDAWEYNAGDGSYTCTVPLIPVDGGPAATINTQLRPPMWQPTGDEDTDEELRYNMDLVANGICTPGNGTVTIKVWDQPDAAVTIFWDGRTGDA